MNVGLDKSNFRRDVCCWYRKNKFIFYIYDNVVKNYKYFVPKTFKKKYCLYFCQK